MSVNSLLLVQADTQNQLWKMRWDGKDVPNWDSDILSDPCIPWHEPWKDGTFYVAAAKGGGFTVYTATDDVLLFAQGDEELGELALQAHLETLVPILASMKKKEQRLSRCIADDHAAFTVALFDTVSPGGKLAYTVLADG
eukprot:TRINITY_DN1327_c0_g1_i1.p4 TRINITY_DN1327_c0_g1~~TRINITY_DN1327_c0_g1_i1.p4  ORF type:complete len:140 (+),score=65.95 TRINITY_DN1327_c0_g1_i1:235-654(+)